MNIGKIVAAVLLLAVGTSLSAQDLASAARKEKERRAALKNRPTITVTNADLENMKKKAAFVGAENAEAVPVGEEGKPAQTEKKPTAVAAEPADAVNVDNVPDLAAARADLQAKYDRAKEHRDYLDLKMRALMQQLYSFNTMESKEKVQRDIADTRVMLQAAEADEAQLKKDLDDFSPTHPIK